MALKAALPFSVYARNTRAQITKLCVRGRANGCRVNVRKGLQCTMAYSYSALVVKTFVRIDAKYLQEEVSKQLGNIKYLKNELFVGKAN